MNIDQLDIDVSDRPIIRDTANDQPGAGSNINLTVHTDPTGS
jgi:hypothetical protein